MHFEIKVGSITNAQRAVKLLKSKGFSPALRRMENPKPGDGCGYVVKVSAPDDSVIRFLEDSGINVIGVEVI